MLMKTLLESKTHIQFIRECVSCKISSEITLPEITEDSIITLEHRFNYDNELKIADVAHTLNGEIKSIYEICNTHKTCSDNRPEPWVEIDAKSLITLVNIYKEPLVINCIRSEKCEKCKSELIKIYKDKNVAINIFKEWIGTEERIDEGNDIYPFTFRDFDGFGYPRLANLCKDNYIPDIIIYDKGSERYYIDLYPKKYTTEFKKELESYALGVYYVNINWILQQTIIPSEIKCIKITDEYNKKNVNNINDLIDTNKFNHLNVKISKNYLIKEYGGKWNKENKVWYMTKYVYNKNKKYIDEFIKDKIIYIGDNIMWNDCDECYENGECDFCNY
jgi:hypothetical protein